MSLVCLGTRGHSKIMSCSEFGAAGHLRSAGLAVGMNIEPLLEGLWGA